MSISSDAVCRVVEVTAETGVDDPPEIPLHLTPRAGAVAIQLRSTVTRICVGAGLARNTALRQQMASQTGYAVAASPAGGTVVLTNVHTLGICAIGVPPPHIAFGLDWMTAQITGWLTTALHVCGVRDVTVGKVEHAWCPGFSDVAAGGRKVVGLGFRVTRDWVVVRGVMPVQPYNDDEMAALIECHRLIDIDVDRHTVGSLAEATTQSVDVDSVIARWRDVVA